MHDLLEKPGLAGILHANSTGSASPFNLSVKVHHHKFVSSVVWNPGLMVYVVSEYNASISSGTCVGENHVKRT